MKSFSFPKLVTLGCFALLLPVACGDDDDSAQPGPRGGSASVGGEPGAGGEAGSQAGAPATIPGTSDTFQTIQCGGKDCDSVATAASGVFIDPCCAGSGEACGVDSQFLALLGTPSGPTCLPTAQPGELDASCPDSPSNSFIVAGVTVDVSGLKGCCRPDNSCGFLVDEVVGSVGQIAAPELGCVESAALGGSQVRCGGGAGGAGSGGAGGGGAGGAGGAP